MTVYRYSGMRLQQRPTGRPILMFAAPASELHKWARVHRMIDEVTGVQRMLNKLHVRSIQKYFEADDSNVIPTAVTLALLPERFEVEPIAVEGFRADAVNLTLRVDESAGEEALPAVVIDGQHRIEALASREESLLVSAIEGATPLDIALHFVVINNKAKRVPTDLVRAILSQMEQPAEHDFRDRVRSIGLTLGEYPSALGILHSDHDSPFCGLLDWDLNRDSERRKVKPAALEGSLKTILADLASPRELDLDDAVSVLTAIWTGVLSVWGADTHWYDTKLGGKAGMVAVTEFVVQRLNLDVEDGLNVLDTDEVNRASAKMMKPIPSEFWERTWKHGSLDTSAGRSLIREDLATIRRNAAVGVEPVFTDTILPADID